MGVNSRRDGVNHNNAQHTSIKVIQVNLNKAHGAQVELLNKINRLNSYLALVTEPYCYKKTLSIPPKNSVILPNKRDEHPRAAIFCSQDIKLNEISELKHRDMAVGVAKMDGKNTLIISLYLDIKFTVTPDFLINALKYAQHRGYSVLIGCDTNSHSTLWGKETNKRGEELEDLITEYGPVSYTHLTLPTIYSV